MWVDGGRIDNIATMADLQITSLKTREHTQEGANEVVDGSMRLIGTRDCSMLALYDVEASVLHFDTWIMSGSLRSRHGDWSEYIVLDVPCMKATTCFDLVKGDDVGTSAPRPQRSVLR
jgi:hypothetical protein